MSPTGVEDTTFERWSSWTISLPASPAPTIRTFRPRATIPPFGRSITVRASRREPATKASSSSGSTSATPRGSLSRSTG